MNSMQMTNPVKFVEGLSLANIGSGILKKYVPTIGLGDMMKSAKRRTAGSIESVALLKKDGYEKTKGRRCGLKIIGTMANVPSISW